MKFGPFCVFLCVWMVLVYSPWVHQIWGGGHLMRLGVWDFAGGICVHTTAGWSSLAACLALGKRHRPVAQAHSIVIVVTGTGILWWGWLGFNGGSALVANGTAVGATANTHISAAM